MSPKDFDVICQTRINPFVDLLIFLVTKCNSLFKKIDINENVNDLSQDVTENKKKILEDWIHQRWVVKEEFLNRYS